MKADGKEITKEMLEKAQACKTAEDLVALAKENGVELTAEEAAAYLAEHEGGKLTGEELDAVAGGKVMKPGGKHKGCFLTTAVCEYLGKADDCEELTALRAYRDQWLAKQPGGLELIEEYYEIAPCIVRAMKDSPNYGELCETLLRRYIRPCLALIAEGRNEECKRLYIEMVRYAEGLVSQAA